MLSVRTITLTNMITTIMPVERASSLSCGWSNLDLLELQRPHLRAASDPLPVDVKVLQDRRPRHADVSGIDVVVGVVACEPMMKIMHTVRAYGKIDIPVCFITQKCVNFICVLNDPAQWSVCCLWFKAYLHSPLGHAKFVFFFCKRQFP